MRIKGIIAAIIISPFYIAFIICGLLLAVIFALLLRLILWLGIIDGLSILFDRTNRIIKRYNLRKLKIT